MPLPYGQGASTLIASPSIAYPGLVLQRILTKEAINLAGSNVQVHSIIIDTVTPSTLYSISVNGFDASVTSPATVTMAQLQAQIIDRLSTIPGISGNFTIAAAGASTIGLTATQLAPNVPMVLGSGFLAVPLYGVASNFSKRVRFGRIVTGRPSWIDGMQVAGLPTAATEKVLGATQYSHGLVRDQNGLDGFVSGDPMSLVKSGQLWMEFSSAVVNPAATGSLYYRSVIDPADPEGSGKLAFGTSAPAGHTLLPGTWSLDSQTSTIADGRIVGLVTLSV